MEETLKEVEQLKVKRLRDIENPLGMCLAALLTHCMNYECRMLVVFRDNLDHVRVFAEERTDFESELPSGGPDGPTDSDRSPGWQWRELPTVSQLALTELCAELSKLPCRNVCFRDHLLYFYFNDQVTQVRARVDGLSAFALYFWCCPSPAHPSFSSVVSQSFFE